MDSATKVCPDCAEEVKAAARICRFCGYNFMGGERAFPRAAGAAAEAGQGDGADTAELAAASPGTIAATAEPRFADAPAGDNFEKLLGLGIAGLVGVLVLVAVLGGGNGGRSAVDANSAGLDMNMDANMAMDANMSLDPLTNDVTAIDAAAPDASAEAAEANWTYDVKDDDVRNKKIYFARATSENTTTFGFPYGTTSLEITVRKHPEWGQDVIFQVAEGQYVCRMDDCEGTINFDGKVEKLSLNEPADHDSKTLFAAYAPSIIAKLKAADKVVIELPFYQEGNRQFTFQTKGLKWPPKVD